MTLRHGGVQRGGLPALWRVGAGLALGMLTGCIYSPVELPVKLGEGDITGVAVGTPSGETAERALQGARVRVRGRSRSVAADARGRFILRNLPEGNHALMVVFDPNADGLPDLGRVLQVPIRVVAGRGKRSGVDLGRVLLLPPGSVRGEVDDPPETDRPVLVGLVDTDLRVVADAARQFLVGVAGEGGWLLVATQADRLSGVREVGLLSGQTVTLEEPLRWPEDQQPGVVEVSVDDSVAREDVVLRVEAAGVAGVAEPLKLGNPPVRVDLAPGLYNVRVTSTDESPLQMAPVRFPNVLVRPGEVTPLVVDVQEADASDCPDHDGDGICAPPLSAQQGSACLVECRTRTDLGTPCVNGTVAWDCDNDGDGQSDAEEALGTLDGQPACHCTATGTDLALPTCDGDATRFDRNHNGICDLDETPGLGTGSSSSGGGTSSSAPGVSSGASASSDFLPSSSASSSAFSSSSLAPSSSSSSSSSSPGGSTSNGAASSSAAPSSSLNTPSSGPVGPPQPDVSGTFWRGLLDDSVTQTCMDAAGVASPWTGAECTPLGQDADLPELTERTFNGTLLVSQTMGLEWQAPATAGAYVWSAAHDACTLLGSGWRLPFIQEALGLLDHGAAASSLVPDGLSLGATPSTHLWTIQGVVPAQGAVVEEWAVQLDVGIPVPRQAALGAAVLCVRRLP